MEKGYVMIAEWQPVMPDDTLKLKSRTIYEFLCSDHSTYLVVGQGTDKEVPAHSLVKDDKVVAFREFETRPAQPLAMTKGGKQ